MTTQTSHNTKEAGMPATKNGKPTLNWEKLAKASMHPLQLQILKLMTDGKERSPLDVAERLKVPLTNASYHFRALYRAKLLKPSRAVPRRGTLQHYYVLAEAAKEKPARPQEGRA